MTLAGYKFVSWHGREKVDSEDNEYNKAKKKNIEGKEAGGEERKWEDRKDEGRRGEGKKGKERRRKSNTLAGSLC